MQIYVHLSSGYLLNRAIGNTSDLLPTLFLSILPDLPYVFHYVYNIYTQGLKKLNWRYVFGPKWSTWLAKFLHSLFVPILLCAISLSQNDGWWQIVVIGYGSHLLLDYLFHAPDYYRPFYPVSDLYLPIPLSYYDSQFHGNNINWMGKALVVIGLGLYVTSFLV